MFNINPISLYALGRLKFIMHSHKAVLYLLAGLILMNLFFNFTQRSPETKYNYAENELHPSIFNVQYVKTLGGQFLNET